MLREHHAAISRAQFLEVDAIATVYLTRCAEDQRRGCNEAFQGEFANAEVGQMLRLTERTAQRTIGLGIDLRWRLHGTSEAFAAGRIDLARAFAISDALANVTGDKLPLIERLLLDGVEELTTTRVRDRARRLIARHDPEGARARRESAEADCDVRFHANEDGTCSIEGTLPGPGGRVVAMRLRAMSFDVCGRDPRTFAQRRADALVALAAGATVLTCRCGHPDCAAAGTAREQDSTSTPPDPKGGAPSDPRSGDTAEQPGLPPLPAATIHVGVNLTTLLGLDDLPGFLAGHGCIDADLAREIAADGTWRKVLTLTDADRESILDALCGHSGRGAPPPECRPKGHTHEGHSGCHDGAGDDADRATRSHSPGYGGTTTSPGLAGSVDPSGVDDLWLSGRRVETLPHGRILGIGRALKAAGITPAAIRERTRHRREQLTYRPSARLAEIVRTRDGVCRFPGCTARASGCDIDHTIPFDHAHPERGGLTVEQNLACLCRRHHRLKTKDDWKVRQLGGGKLEWTSPTGERVVTHPAGAFEDNDRAVHEALAAAHGLTLTDAFTLDQLFGPYRGRGAVDDLSYLVDLNRPRRGAPPSHGDTTVPLREIPTAAPVGPTPAYGDDPPPF